MSQFIDQILCFENHSRMCVRTSTKSGTSWPVTVYMIEPASSSTVGGKV